MNAVKVLIHNHYVWFAIMLESHDFVRLAVVKMVVSFQFKHIVSNPINCISEIGFGQACKSSMNCPKPWVCRCKQNGIMCFWYFNTEPELLRIVRQSLMFIGRSFLLAFEFFCHGSLINCLCFWMSFRFYSFHHMFPRHFRCLYMLCQNQSGWLFCLL